MKERLPDTFNRYTRASGVGKLGAAVSTQEEGRAEDVLAGSHWKCPEAPCEAVAGDLEHSRSLRARTQQERTSTDFSYFHFGGN